MSEKGNASKSQTARDEEAILAFWKKEKIFEKSVSNREGAELFSFYDGPPFANGLPHFGHSLVTSIKDSILRYKTMRGYYVPRRNGWDCHGLPVEYDIEKQLKISGKKQIEEYGIEKFNKKCLESIFAYKADWEEFLSRIGRWSDYENYYATVDKNYTESVWWVLSEIHKKGLLKKGFKSTPYCVRCETPLSNFELNEGYKDDVPDPSVIALFPLEDEPDTSLLAWTTTPWTLPANAALAVTQKAEYALIQINDTKSKIILAKNRLEVLGLADTEYKIIKTLKGNELIGKAYKPLYPVPKSQKFTEQQIKKAWKVYADTSVSLDEGTGILHVAPRYGESDLGLGLRENLPLIESIDRSGHIISAIPSTAGKFFKSADKLIIADLAEQGRIFAAETANHTYPFCWRCETPLVYYATESWFISVSEINNDLLRTAKNINWVPSNIKEGRFGKWLEGAKDWAISRNRYWGAPMPIWVNIDDEKDYIVVSSIKELVDLAGSKAEIKDLHRPFIDEIEFSKDGKTYRRVSEVLDCWFESGSMAAASWHYPFENEEIFKKNFPADFVIEGLDQTRLWFYVQHVVNTILFGNNTFNNVIVNGIINAADGQKLSKRLKNYPPANEVFSVEGADAWRLYLLSSTQATETASYMRFDRQAMSDLKRNVCDKFESCAAFFMLYSDIDNWKPESTTLETNPKSVLDKWILARTDEVVAKTTKSADSYKIAHSILPIFELIDDLSNWYVRRSRRRFWKSQEDQDKEEAYQTLQQTLLRISIILAPWAPFLSDKVFRQCKSAEMPESVHLTNWPELKEITAEKTNILEEMAAVRNLVAVSLSQRAEAKIKVRQPLGSLQIFSSYKFSKELLEIIKEEVNVKSIVLNESKTEKAVLDINITDTLRDEGYAREMVRLIQSARKKANFEVSDRIMLKIEIDSSPLLKAYEHFKEKIDSEVLAVGELETDNGVEYTETQHIEGHEVKLSLSRAV